MQEAIFTDKSAIPSENEIQDALLDSYSEWKQIQHYVESNYGSIQTEWKFYSKKFGWLQKTILKKRNLFFFKPCHGRFVLTFVLGEKAVAEIVRSEISEKAAQEIVTAPKHAEGRSVSILVEHGATQKDVMLLIDHKIRF